MAEQFQMILNNLAERVMIPDKTIRNIDTDGDGNVDGFQFDFKNPFYTAQPISAIRDFSLKVDGEKPDPRKVTLNIRGQEILASKAHTVYEIWIGLGEVISVFVEKPGGLKSGEHNMELILHMRTTIPYGFETDGYVTFPANVTMKVI